MIPQVAIFVVTFNRLDTLTKTIESYKRFSTPHQVIIVNNGTDHPECVELLKNLEKEYKVYNMSKIFSMPELENNITAAVRDFYHNDTDRIPYYAVSDCDCCFDIARHDTLDVYIELSNNAAHGKRAVGPHYVVHDLPVNYPLRTYAIRGQSLLLYKNQMSHYRDDIYYSPTAIDSTFVLFHRYPEFRRLRMDTIRVNTPFAARHLDWYIDFLNPSKENFIYINKESLIGSYGGSWIKGFFGVWNQSKEEAFRQLSAKISNPNDHCIDTYILSWMYQFGHGCEKDIEKAKNLMIKGSPNWSPVTAKTADALKMVFENDFSCLG